MGGDMRWNRGENNGKGGFWKKIAFGENRGWWKCNAGGGWRRGLGTDSLSSQQTSRSYGSIR